MQSAKYWLGKCVDFVIKILFFIREEAGLERLGQGGVGVEAGGAGGGGGGGGGSYSSPRNGTLIVRLE